jgi:hypothetical protein
LDLLICKIRLVHLIPDKERLSHLQPHFGVLRVSYFLAWNKLADRARGVKPFGKCPGMSLLLGLVLKISGCHVQGQHIASNVRACIGLGDIFARLTDDHSKLYLMVKRFAAWGSLKYQV